MSKLRLLLILIAAIAVTAVSAQDSVVPVRWRTVVKMTSPTEGKVTFRALVAQGWHLYGLEIPQGGPKATRFDLGASTGIEFTSPVQPSREPLTVDDPLFGMSLTWWDSNVNFTVPFRLTGEGTPELKATISYMSCDGNSCRPPRTERINAPVPPYQP